MNAKNLKVRPLNVTPLSRMPKSWWPSTRDRKSCDSWQECSRLSALEAEEWRATSKAIPFSWKGTLDFCSTLCDQVLILTQGYDCGNFLRTRSEGVCSRGWGIYLYRKFKEIWRLLCHLVYFFPHGKHGLRNKGLTCTTVCCLKKMQHSLNQEFFFLYISGRQTVEFFA